MTTPIFQTLEEVNGEAKIQAHPALKRTDAERTAGVTPVNYAYPPDPVDPRRYGAVGDGATDDTTAMQTALNMAYATNGELRIPNNFNMLCGALSLTMVGAANRAIRIVGGSQIGSRITAKNGLSATSLLKFTQGTPIGAPVEAQIHLENFSLYGMASGITSGVHGLTLEGVADWVISGVRVTGFDRGHNIDSSLVGTVNSDSQCVANNYGVYIRSSTLSSPPHLIRYEHCKINLNSKIGVDYNGGSQLQLYSNDIEGNGTAADTTTGGVFIRGALAQDSLVAGVLLDSNWLEGNKGYSVYVEAPTGGVSTDIVIRGGNVIAAESGRAIKVLGATNLLIESLQCLTPGDTWDLTADKSCLRNVITGTLTDSGVTFPTYQNVTVSGGTFYNGRSENVTLTLTGCTTSPTTAAVCTQQGSEITIQLQDLTAVSNTTACTLTGLSARYQPTSGNEFVPAVVEDNSVDTAQVALLQVGSGTITLYKNGSTTGFTAAGSKGVRRCVLKFRK